ncbi:hypothetical protein JM18_004223 [Phytophthora kernoviae]|uniref:Uncharacterized protein n=2 Tax=Phytophthora kernoviae TaxID=325452 RepID=A0A8T0M052_9STRA|nr:hypothetical protein G195_005436 [Phytophthora kernoviae 00238/432]KAG2524991.1 hypothetical protein JM16_004432 [Phytophthora kernoviae]KAG2526762.1 hypothetical protein JM18_004223 [Phytophthora kernoviae]
MTDLTLRLATCDDADVLATELIAVLPDLAATQDLQASVQGVAAFLAEEEERWSSCVHNLLLYLRGEPQERNVVLELLDATLFSAAQWQGQLTLKTQKTLVEFFQTVITEIGNGGDSGRWLKWGDQVLILVYKQREQEQVAEEKEDAEESRQWFVDIAGLLLQLRNTLAGNEAVSPDLKLETFVWKNLAKLATAFGPILTSCSAAINSPSKEQDGDKQETGRFGAEEAVAAVVSSVEESVGQLLRGASAGVLDAGVLKFFRLYWKAFHRLLVAFADVLDSEVENCVLAIVNVAASLIYIIQQNKDSAMSKGGQELRNMLDQAVEMIEKMTGSTPTAA